MILLDRKYDFNGMEGKKMKDKILKFIGIVLVATILIFSISIFLTQKEIEYFSKQIIEVKEKPLSVRIFADTSSGTSPLTVNFKPLLINNRDNTEFHWDFGDGNISNEEKPIYIFKKSGIFRCKLTIKDGNTTASDSFNITVLPNNPPDFKIIVSKTTGFRPEEIKFDVQVFDPEGDEVTYLWKVKYPPFFSNEKVDKITKKNFTKKFIRNGNYVAELTVTDEAGNSVTQFVRIQISKSEFESNIGSITNLITKFKTVIWPILEGNFGPKLYDFLDSFWLDLHPFFQKMIAALLDYLNIRYDPIIPYANLEFLDIEDINHSLTVNSKGDVNTQTSVSSIIKIKNNDSNNIAKNIYITLVNPITEDKGLNEEIELDELEVSIYSGGVDKKLFFDGSYKNFKNGYLIDSLDYGDEFLGNLVVTLNKAADGTFTDDQSYPCNLYIFQEKAAYVDEVPFTILT
ncbi:hypothetical protein AYK20_02580 [Thermoplasmatales archaeon SG8-52-1]|nr:MAG: hypothetical protein AYK20_02580 [Thermoplasmatales archaeon SG8-52-1]